MSIEGHTDRQPENIMYLVATKTKLKSAPTSDKKSIKKSQTFCSDFLKSVDMLQV